MERIKRLLKSISRISPVCFVIDDKEQLLFSQDREGNLDLAPFLSRFSARISEEDRFLRESNGNGYDFYGLPVTVGDNRAATLMAYEGNGTGSPIRDSAESMEDLLLAVADVLAGWVTERQESDQMAEQLAHSFEVISLYARITPQIASPGFSDAMLRSLLVDLLEIMNADLIFTSLSGRQEYSLLVTREEIDLGVEPEVFARSLVTVMPPDASRVEENYYVVNDSKAVPQYEKLHERPFRLLIAPVQHQANPYGWLGLVSFQMEEIFRYGDLRMLNSVGKQIAVALANVDLYAELESFVINMVRSLVSAIEAKDVYTRGHSERVSRYCMRMAERLHLSRDEKRRLLWASILHDMGKIGIPESVLNKPGRLTDEEYLQIKMHPEKGYNILKNLKPLAEALPGILHHHERYDGKGYPQGLKGEEIPFHARIIAVADTFDAITSDRSYRGRKTDEQALAIIREVAGEQLDARLVKVFEGLFEYDGGMEMNDNPLDALEGVGRA